MLYRLYVTKADKDKIGGANQDSEGGYFRNYSEVHPDLWTFPVDIIQRVTVHEVITRPEAFVSEGIYRMPRDTRYVEAGASPTLEQNELRVVSNLVTDTGFRDEESFVVERITVVAGSPEETRAIYDAVRARKLDPEEMFDDSAFVPVVKHTDVFAIYKTDERPTFPNQILDPSTLSAGMKIGFLFICDGKSRRDELTIKEINHEEGWLSFEDWYGTVKGIGKVHTQMSFADLGLAPYPEQWHTTHHCFTL